MIYALKSVPRRTQASSKAHLEALDGLRGVAAIAVVLHHFGGVLVLPYLMPRGYLAVDLFFVLSGYVIAYAYASRLRTMPLAAFAQLRAIRLYPMIIIGTTIGIVLALFRLRGHEPALPDMIKASFLGILALPVLFTSTLPFETFPINGPVWSLTFELIACGVFALIVKCEITRPAAFALCAVGGVALFPIAYFHHGVSVGPLPSNWVGGFARVGFSFFVGVLLQNGWVRPPRVSSPIALLLCLLPILIPTSQHFNGLIDLLAVIVCFPFGISALSNVIIQGRWTKFCNMSGDASYALYAIHYPVVLACASVWRLQVASWPVRLLAASVVTVLLTRLAMLLLEFLDEPVRHWLVDKSKRLHA